MVKIGSILSDFHLLHEFLPIRDDERFDFARLETGEIVHHCPGATVLVGSGLHVCGDDVAVIITYRRPERRTETLEENPVDSVFLHPLEMPHDRLFFYTG